MIYGDGMQVRDVLYVEDLVNALLLAQARVDDIAGRAFNIGGGPQNAISLLELIDTIAAIHGERPSHSMRPWRLGDQRYYVTDPSNFRAATGWTPTVRAQRGVELLYQWLVANRV